MKKYILYALVMFAACKPGDNDKVKAFIPGTYVTTINQEFSRGNDTLIIRTLSPTGNNYEVIRRTSYQRLYEGKILPLERETEKWLTVYDKDLKVLRESDLSRVC